MSAEKKTVEFIKWLGWIDSAEGQRALLYGITNHPKIGDEAETQAATTSPVISITYPRNRTAHGEPSMIETVNTIYVRRAEVEA